MKDDWMKDDWINFLDYINVYVQHLFIIHPIIFHLTKPATNPKAALSFVRRVVG